MNYGVSTNGELLIVQTEMLENFYFHDSQTGWVMDTNRMKEVPKQWVPNKQ